MLFFCHKENNSLISKFQRSNFQNQPQAGQAAYKDQLTEYGLKVGDSEVLKAHGMQVDEDACLGVLIYSDHLEEAKSFITYIMGDGNTPDENEGGQK